MCNKVLQQCLGIARRWLFTWMAHEPMRDIAVQVGVLLGHSEQSVFMRFHRMIILSRSRNRYGWIGWLVCSFLNQVNHLVAAWKYFYALAGHQWHYHQDLVVKTVWFKADFIISMLQKQIFLFFLFVCFSWVWCLGSLISVWKNPTVVSAWPLSKCSEWRVHSLVKFSLIFKWCEKCGVRFL